ADETGWKLSTTRAAAVFSRTLQAANPTATSDELLDWLKSAWLRWDEEGTETTQAADMALARAAGHLETWCRRHGMLSAWSLQVPPASEAASADDALPRVIPEGRQAMPASAVRLWHWARGAVSPLQALWRGRRARLQDWLAALRDTLAAAGSLRMLAQDPAGELALQALRFDAASQAA